MIWPLHAGTQQQLLQHLTRPVLLALVLVITRGCASLERSKFTFKNGVAPPWWPCEEVPFSDYSSKAKPQLISLCSALIAEGQKSKELKADMVTTLYDARQK